LFPAAYGIAEDPVTGSLNAAAGQWLMESGHAPEHYRVAQGTRLGRAGRVHIDRVEGTIWVGGACAIVLQGTAAL
jgi:PhzF family phenazine biosynthesis protein